MRSALVLNATYEPLSVVPARRAVCLVIDDKADLIEHDGTVLRSESLELQSPLVIRLRYLVRVPYHRRTSMSRRAIFARDDFRCQYCGGIAESIDHVMPRSRGGQHVWENVAAACRRCNHDKRDRTPEEAGMRLARVPAAPRESAWVVMSSFGSSFGGSTGGVPEEWKPYLARAS